MLTHYFIQFGKRFQFYKIPSSEIILFVRLIKRMEPFKQRMIKAKLQIGRISDCIGQITYE